MMILHNDHAFVARGSTDIEATLLYPSQTTDEMDDVVDIRFTGMDSNNGRIVLMYGYYGLYDAGYDCWMVEPAEHEAQAMMELARQKESRDWPWESYTYTVDGEMLFEDEIPF
jgi:hypothetical protein